MEQILNVKLKPLTLLSCYSPFHPLILQPLKPPPSTPILFPFFCIIFTHRTKSLIFFPHTVLSHSSSMANRSTSTLPPAPSVAGSPLTVQSSSRLVRHRWVFVWWDSDCGQNIYRYSHIFIWKCDVFGGWILPPALGSPAFASGKKTAICRGHRCHLDTRPTNHADNMKFYSRIRVMSSVLNTA